MAIITSIASHPKFVAWLECGTCGTLVPVQRDSIHYLKTGSVLCISCHEMTDCTCQEAR